MANNYNNMPIYIDTVMTQGWRASQTLNTGNLPATLQNPGPITRQWGIRVTKIEWTGIAALNHRVIVTDPVDGAVKFQTTAQSLVDAQFDVVDKGFTWKDFKVSTLDSGVLLIHYVA